jgi:DNA-binding IclR family transcriptional regulator
LCVECFSAPGAPTIRLLKVGACLSLERTAGGKVLLAFSQGTALQDCPPRALRVAAAASNNGFDGERQEIQAQGFAREIQEFVSDFCSVAAPVQQRLDGKAVAALSLSVPVARYIEAPLAAAVVRGADVISKRLTTLELLHANTRYGQAGRPSRRGDAATGERATPQALAR